ncbi:hypothetical protein TREMEDRAFT_42981, partial [Tremella mesenterica DSM 1558]|uniref:uncharacterized protein n=1 Tax=Tremella mesenterica (strain ATCC 24925 / CBS 8224 / DSM 1558 / NBRC 9311 / NRRL Y-6157 / RJB 2259-6 / UBC 559-6) TaxID=578456 RepID=UPI0003F49360
MSHPIPCTVKLSFTQEQLRAIQDPTNGVRQFSESYPALNDRRQQLPAWQGVSRFFEAFEKSQVVIVSAETGSGKSTQLPQACAHLLEGSGCAGKVFITQPRRLAARSVAERLAEEMDDRLGGMVGLQMKGLSVMPKDSTKARIQVFTDGFLIAKLSRDPLLSDCGVVIVDEVHERGVNIDILLGFLRLLIPTRPDLRVICMSATGDNATLLEHFAPFRPELVVIPGVAKTIHHHFLLSTPRSWMESAFQTVRQIVTNINKTYPPGDMLIFCPGEGEIHQLCDDLEFLYDAVPEMAKFKVLKLYRTLPKIEQDKVMADSMICSNVEEHICNAASGCQRYRKIIVSTNIAETSLTFPHLVYLLDCGFNRMPVYSAVIDAQELLEVPNSRAQTHQRCGRVGRTQDGYAYHLYEKSELNKMMDHQRCPLRRTDLSQTLLKLLALNLPTGSAWSFPWPTRPHPAQILRAADQLTTTGFMEKGEMKLNKKGQLASNLDLSLPLARLFLQAQGSPVGRDLLTLIAVLEQFDLLHSPAEEQVSASGRWKDFIDPRGDPLSRLNIFNAWLAHQRTDESVRFARSAYVSWEACVSIEERIEELVSMWEDRKFPTLPPSPPHDAHWHSQMGLHLCHAYMTNLSKRYTPPAKPKQKSVTVYKKLKERGEQAHQRLSEDMHLYHGRLMSSDAPPFLVYTSVRNSLQIIIVVN